MLKVYLRKSKDEKDKDFFLFCVNKEEVTYSIILSLPDLVSLEPHLHQSLYGEASNFYLEFMSIRSDNWGRTFKLTFNGQVPMLTFEIERVEMVKVYSQVSEALKEATLETI